MLSNTVYKLTKEKKLKIAYFGGSILDGACSSDMETKSCRALVSRWFTETYPDADITSLNACIGGTGTGFGMFRIEGDVLRYEPDLIFIEYATNDWEDEYDIMVMQAESILRKIRGTLPLTDVVMVMATDDDITDVTDTGIEYESRTAHSAAAHRYGVPVVDPGAATYAWLLKNKAEKDALSPDKQHPNDLGYRVMADCMIKWLGDMFAKAGHPDALTPHTMPKQLSERVFDGAYMVYCEEMDDLEYNGFTFKSAKDGERVKTYLDSTCVGDRLSFDFKGKVFGICYIGGFLGTDVLVSVDGKEAKRVDSWDNYIRSFHRIRAAIVYDDLDPGVTHTVCVTVAGCDSPHVGIGGFFLCRE